MARGLLLRRFCPRLAILLTSLAASALAQNVPFFGPDVPADNTIFYAIPGQPFTGLSSVLVSDNDANGTTAGTIVRTGVVRIWRGSYIGPTPTIEPLCDAADLDAATRERCKYYCLETPAPSGAQGCGLWPASSQMGIGDATSFNYTMEPATSGRVWTNRTRFSFRVNDPTNWGSSVTFPSPFRRVCLTINSADATTLQARITRCWSILYRIAPALASCEYDRTKPRKPCRYDIFPSDVNPEVKVAVGQTLVTNVYFDLLSPGDTLDIAVLADPGLPNGASIGPIRGGPNFRGAGLVSDTVTHPGSSELIRNVYSKGITFTPSPQDAIKVGSTDESGIVYPICFQSVSRANASASGIFSAPICTRIRVVRPEPQRTVAVTCPSCTQPLDTRKFTAMVRCTYTWSMLLYERKDFDVHYMMDGQLVPGATEPRFEVSGYKAGIYAPRAEADPLNPLPRGAELMEPVKYRHCIDMNTQTQNVNMPFNTVCESKLLRNVYSQELVWTPPRGLESSTINVCFRIAGTPGMDPNIVVPEQICSEVTVSKCRVCTVPGDTLQSIAKDYRTDWLQLWGANVLVDSPSNLKDYGYITLGPTYKISKKSEPMNIVAGTYGMTIDGLVELNPDLKGMVTLQQGTDVCVVPPVCKSTQLTV